MNQQVSSHSAMETDSGLLPGKVPDSRYQQTLYILVTGSSVAINFALAKYGVTHGHSAFSLLIWPVTVAALILLGFLILRRGMKQLRFRHLPYYLIAGFLGVSAPNLASNLALKEISASVFSVLITLSPIFTLLLSAIFQKSALSWQRGGGILLGLTAVLLLVLTPASESGKYSHIAPSAFLLALLVPFLLACGNVYRSKAMPGDADPVALATGMLLSQSLILHLLNTGVSINSGFSVPDNTMALQDLLPDEAATLFTPLLIIMGLLTAFSYLMTFRLQKLTDGLGFSQVGYVVTLVGVAIGILFFQEPFDFRFVFSLILLFAGIGLTNGHFFQVTFLSKTTRT